MPEVRLPWGAWKKDAERKTRGCLPKRIRRRETLGPPVSCSRVQAHGQGRGASLEEMPVAHEARVLVVESSGKQKSVVRIQVVFRGASQGKLQEGGLARSKRSIR